MRKLTLIALAIGLAAALAACGSDSENQLVARPWQLTAITERSRRTRASSRPRTRAST